MSLDSKRLLVVAAMISAATALPNCGVNDPSLPDGTGGGAGKSSSIVGTGGTTGGSTSGSGNVGIGGSSFDFGGSSGIVGTGGANTGSGGAGGVGGARPDAGDVSGPRCGKVTLKIDDAGHIPSDSSDLVALINGPNATTEAYPLAATGGGGHTHTITFSAAQIMTLRNGGMVTVTSTMTENHLHMVTVSCTKI